MKSDLRWSRCSGTTRRRIEQAITRGWRPGLSPKDFLRKRRQANEGRWDL